MTSKRLIVFDIDGTLTDTTIVDDTCFFRTFEQCFDVQLDGVDYTDFQNVTDWGITEELFEQTINRTISPKEMEHFKTIFLKDLAAEAKQSPSQFQAVEGAIAFLNELKQTKNIGVAIATGAWKESAEIKLKTAGIPFDNLPLSHSNLFKSREEILTHAIENAKAHYDCDFNDTVYFGDGKWDFVTCANLNIPFIGIDCHQNGKLKKLGVTKVYKDFTEVISNLPELGGFIWEIQ